MINDINFFIQWYVYMSHYLWPHGQLSEQSDIPGNSDVSEVVINFVVSIDNLLRWCGLKITTRPLLLCMQENRMYKYSCVLSLRSMAAGSPGGGGVGAEGMLLPYKRLMGMCRWMEPHFHEWSDYNGVAFSRVTRMGSRIFWFLGVRQFFIFTVSKRTRMFVL